MDSQRRERGPPVTDSLDCGMAERGGSLVRFLAPSLHPGRLLMAILLQFQFIDSVRIV